MYVCYNLSVVRMMILFVVDVSFFSIKIFLDYSFETTHNIVILGVEFAPTMKVAMREWNMTVQWWMATYVYKKLPFKSNQTK